MYVKPADRLIEGMPLVVRDPDCKDLLPPEGREVPVSDYWHRRLRDGDVVLSSPPLAVVTVAQAQADEIDRPYQEVRGGDVVEN